MKANFNRAALAEALGLLTSVAPSRTPKPILRCVQITAEDKESEYFVAGVSCPYCHDRTSEEDKARYAEREKQVALAEESGRQHIGPNAMDPVKESGN